MGRFRWLFVIAAFGLLALTGLYGYNLGLAHGLLEAGRVAPGPGVTPVPLHVWVHPYGWFPLAPLFFVLFIFVVLRGLFWRAGWHARGYGYGCGYRGWSPSGVPPAFEEWHRRAHAQPTAPSTPPADLKV